MKFSTDPRWPVWGTLMELEFRVGSLNKLISGEVGSGKGSGGRKHPGLFLMDVFLFFFNDSLKFRT